MKPHMQKDEGVHQAKLCSTDHTDDSQLICRIQSDGTRYDYCDECGWVDVQSFVAASQTPKHDEGSAQDNGAAGEGGETLRKDWSGSSPERPTLHDRLYHLIDHCAEGAHHAYNDADMYIGWVEDTTQKALELTRAEGTPSKHIHKYTVPVEWVEGDFKHEVKENGKTVSAYYEKGYHVVKLRCESCTEEISR